VSGPPICLLNMAFIAGVSWNWTWVGVSS